MMIRIAKASARTLGLLLVSWRLAVYFLSSLLIDKEKAFTAASESIARIPGMRGVYQRQAFYRSKARPRNDQRAEWEISVP